MNIKLYTGNNEITNYNPSAATADRSKAVAGKAAGNYDKVTFSKSSAPVSETSFSRVLARETASLIEQTDNHAKVFRLQQQVASGTYVPNSQTIAERILGYR